MSKVLTKRTECIKFNDAFERCVTCKRGAADPLSSQEYKAGAALGGSVA